MKEAVMPKKICNEAAVERKREREMVTASQMISIYCAGNHKDAVRDLYGKCGEAICAECKELDDYACLRTKRCRRMADKISCEACENHCYAPAMRKRIRRVMRYAGPRMLLKHPVSAMRHLAGKLGS